MDRRAFLATTVSSIGLAVSGCLGDDGDSGDTPGETGTAAGEPRTGTPGTPTATDAPATVREEPSPTSGDGTLGEDDTTTPADGVAVEDIVVRKAVTFESTMGSGGVLASDGRQYVVASVRSDRSLSAEEFAFLADEESWEPGLPNAAGAMNYAVAGHEGGPVGRSMGGAGSYLGFEVSSPLSASEPRIRHESSDSEWPLSEGAETTLAAPAARFELVDLTVPSRVSQGETLRVSLTVRNVAETDGRFLAAVYWPTNLIADDDESHVVERTVSAGDETTATVDIDTEYTTNETETVFLRVAGHVAAQRQVAVEDVSTPD